MFDFLGGGGPGQLGNAGPGNAGNAGASPGFDWMKLANAGASLGPAKPGAQAGVADQMQAMQQQRREMELWELLKKRLAQQKLQAGQMPDAMGDVMGGPPMGAGY